jgi:hypothetical protein
MYQCEECEQNIRGTCKRGDRGELCYKCYKKVERDLREFEREWCFDSDGRMHLRADLYG